MSAPLSFGSPCELSLVDWFRADDDEKRAALRRFIAAQVAIASTLRDLSLRGHRYRAYESHWIALRTKVKCVPFFGGADRDVREQAIAAAGEIESMRAEAELRELDADARADRVRREQMGVTA